MKTKIYHIKFDNRFATLTEEEYKKLVAKGKKIVVLYIKQGTTMTIKKDMIVYLCNFNYRCITSNNGQNKTFHITANKRIVDKAGSKKVTFYDDTNENPCLVIKSITTNLEIQVGIPYLHIDKQSALKALRMFASNNSYDGVNKIHPNKYIKSIAYEIIDFE